ncbi:MAG: type II secretion system protein [Planctomycetota bacterium]
MKIIGSRYNLGRGAGRWGAFTLLEMLVVLGLTSMLMAILLGGLGKVRRRARTAQKMSNLREIVGGVNLYAIDRDNRYPPSVAAVSSPIISNWNWSDPRKMTIYWNTELGPHRAMSEYLREYIKDASIMYCPSAPEKYPYLQQAWDAGDDWDNPRSGMFLSHDAMSGTYCFYWNYAGLVDGRLFKGPGNLCGGRGQSELLVSDYFGFAHYQNENAYGGNYFAYGSCEHFTGAHITPGEPTCCPGKSAFWSRLESEGFNLNTINIRLHAGYADGHVESYKASEAATMKVIKLRSTNEPYEYDEHGPGYFYLPVTALH